MANLLANLASFFKYVKAGDLNAVTRTVMSRAVRVDAHNEFGHTSLMYAARNGHLSIVEYLCSVGANADLKDKWGETALHLAAQAGFLPIVQFLATKGNVETKDEFGRNALHHAAEKGHLSIVEYLCSVGANAETMDCWGKTALHYAAGEGCLPVVRYLMTTAKVDVNSQSSVGCTALGVASGEGHLSIVKYLVLEGKAVVDVQDKQGFTALTRAMLEGWGEIAKWLTRHGADPHLKSDIGSAVDMAREALACAPLEEVEYIQHLVEHLTRPCGNLGCEARGSKKCGRCCKVRYCSVECQTVNWAVHKQECSSDGER